MAKFVTARGLVFPSFDENKKYYEGALSEIAKEQNVDVDLDPSGPVGQLIGVLSKRDSDLFEWMAEIYTARDADQATGVALDSICAETGVIRLPAGRTVVERVNLELEIGTILEAGVSAKQTQGENSDLTFSLLNKVVAEYSKTKMIELKPVTPSEGIVYEISINGGLASYTAGAADSVDNVIGQLITLLEADSTLNLASIENIEGTKILIEGVDFFNITYGPSLELEKYYSYGSFQADEIAPVAVPVNTLNAIVTPQTGWLSVSNPIPGLKGREVESDSELRIRRNKSLISGNATEDAIQQKLLSEVDGVSQVSVESNRTSLENADGLPAKSFECVVAGGLAEDIALKIWTVAPAGIEPHGTIAVNITDSVGDNQKVKFSRPTPVYIFIKIDIQLYDEETFPDGGIQQIKDALVEYATKQLSIDKDVIRKRLYAPIYTVPGIGDVTIKLDSSTNIMHTPVYAEKDIVINNKEFAVVQQSTVIVIQASY